MEFIVKFEIVEGTFRNRQNEDINYRNLKLYTMTVNEDKLTWSSVPKDTQYEQVTAAGGVRERSQIWVSIDELRDRSTNTDQSQSDHPGYRSGTRINRFFGSYSLNAQAVEKIFGCTLDEFSLHFASEFFLHGVRVMKFTNEYGRDEIESIDVSADTVLDALAAAAASNS